ncbi:substrate-binding domain-containing protein, partial [Klebsiella oxytoca]
KVRLSLQSLNCYSIRDALLDDDVDLGVFYRVGNDEALKIHYFGDQQLVLVASPEHDPVNFMRRDQHIPLSFIINEPQCIFRQIFESELRKRGITLENTIELWSIESIKQCVAGNLGVSYLPRFAVEQELREGKLAELPFSKKPLTINAVCGYHAGKVVSPAMQVFVECMEECLKI